MSSTGGDERLVDLLSDQVVVVVHREADGHARGVVARVGEHDRAADALLVSQLAKDLGDQELGRLGGALRVSAESGGHPS